MIVRNFRISDFSFREVAGGLIMVVSYLHPCPCHPEGFDLSDPSQIYEEEVRRLDSLWVCFPDFGARERILGDLSYNRAEVAHYDRLRRERQEE